MRNEVLHEVEVIDTSKKTLKTHILETNDWFVHVGSEKYKDRHAYKYFIL